MLQNRRNMKNNKSEAKVLKKLNIPDFRHMTKDKVVNLVSMLPQMDPGVAMKALEQFPSFAETSLSIITSLKDELDRVLDKNSENMAGFNSMCQSVLETLEAELSKPELSDEGRRMVIDGIIEITTIIGQKDSENKEFLTKLFGGLLGAGALVVTVLVAVLGLNINASAD